MVPRQRRPLPLTDRFGSMLSATKFLVAGAMVALFGGFLLAGVLTQPSEESVPGAAASASAIAEDADALASSVFRLRITGYVNGDPPGMSHACGGSADTGPVTITGLALVGERRADQRAFGSMTEIWNVFDVVAGDEILVGRGSARVENADGAWVGTAERYAVGWGVEEGTVRWELVRGPHHVPVGGLPRQA